MALISCPDCNKQISEDAPCCPNCGSPIKELSSFADSQSSVEFVSVEANPPKTAPPSDQPQVPPTDTLKGALIKCAVCGKEISDTANACVSCGAPVVRTSKTYAPTEAHIKQVKKKKRDAIILIAIGLLLCLTAIGMIIGIPFVLIGLWYLLFKGDEAKNLVMGDCPNCKRSISFDRSVSSVSCPTCHKLILINGYTMTINN